MRTAIGAQRGERCQMPLGEESQHVRSGLGDVDHPGEATPGLLRHHVAVRQLPAAIAWRTSSFVARHAGITAASTPVTNAATTMNTIADVGTVYVDRP